MFNEPLFYGWFIAFFTTDLTLSAEQIVEYYDVRWKTESGFKELKQEIGSANLHLIAQTRNSFAVENHLNFDKIQLFRSRIFFFGQALY